jgi:hypothetical protein
MIYFVVQINHDSQKLEPIKMTCHHQAACHRIDSIATTCANEQLLASSAPLVIVPSNSLPITIEQSTSTSMLLVSVDNPYDLNCLLDRQSQKILKKRLRDRSVPSRMFNDEHRQWQQRKSRLTKLNKSEREEIIDRSNMNEHIDDSNDYGKQVSTWILYYIVSSSNVHSTLTNDSAKINTRTHRHVEQKQTSRLSI